MGPIFPEFHRPWAESGDSTTHGTKYRSDPSPGTPSSSLQTMVLSQLSKPQSHPIKVTAEDVEHGLTSLELAQAPLEQPWEQQSASLQQPLAGGHKHRQPMQTATRRHSRAASMTSGPSAALQPSRTKGHRRSNSGEAQPAVSHFVLPGKRPQGRALVQEPPLSTRSSYRLDWENAPQLSALSIGQSSTGDSNCHPIDIAGT